MAKKKSIKENLLKRGIGAMLQPGSTLVAPSTNLPDSAISCAAQLNQFNSLQPLQAYEMSVAGRKAVHAIVSQAARSVLRIFTKDGDEVVAGDAYNFFARPAPCWSTQRFLNDIMSFRLISGEIAISMLRQVNTDGATKSLGRPLGMIPLAPNRLYPIDPVVPNELNDIKTWQYTLGNGMCVQYPSESIIFAPNFNPSSHIRGLSPFVTGVNAASVSYQALRYMKDYYTNNAVPSHIIVLQKGLSEKQRKDWEQRYLEQYSTYNNQSQKVIVSSGTDLDVKKLDSEQKTQEQISLLRYSDEQLSMLYSVPPTVMGMFDKVRFETAAIERSMFLEDAVLPLISTVQDVLQSEIMDKFFQFSTITRGMGKKITKSFRNLLDKRISDSASNSDYIVVLDPDSIPLMSQINIDKFNAIDTLCTKGRLSPNEAAEFLSVEIPYNPLRDKIFVPAGFVELTENMGDNGVLPLKDQTNLEVEGDIQHSNDPNQRTMAETQEDEKLESSPETTKRVHDLHNLYRAIRKHVLTNNQNNAIYTLKEADDICVSAYKECPVLKKEIRKDLFNLKRLLKNKSIEDRAKDIRAFYNGKKQSYLRTLVIKSKATGVFKANPECCDICDKLDEKECSLDANIEDISHPNCKCEIVERE